MTKRTPDFWAIESGPLLEGLKTSARGLSSEEAQRRLAEYGANRLKPKKHTDIISLLAGQFKSPIILILMFAAVLSIFLKDQMDATIILCIVLLSGLLGFWQERGATRAVEDLLAMVQTLTTVLRDGKPKELPVEEVVPGDVVLLAAGDAVPGDCLILEGKDLFVDEATLTGESYPVEKLTGSVPKDTPLSQRKNCLFMGTHVVSGSGEAVAINTGTATEFGKVSERLRLRPPETEFERGVRRFGYLLMEVTLLLVVVILVVSVARYGTDHEAILRSFLFAMALAVGLTPQLLPAIISVNLAYGAKKMADQKVIVKRLPSIENLGSMDVLCSDKTGTITEGVVRLRSALGIEAKRNAKAHLYAYLNAMYQTGFKNPIDQAILAHSHSRLDVAGYEKLDEVPYDFVRKRLSVLVRKGDAHLMVTKGAMSNVMGVCSSAENADGTVIDISVVQKKLQRRFERLSQYGYRVLGLAYRNLPPVATITKDNEENMIFLGMLVFYDPPKHGIDDTIRQLNQLGISLKIISGDNRFAVARLGQELGVSDGRVLTGPELREMSDEALLRRATETDLFAEVEPNQKERIIIALKKGGHVVGFIGDGINDASALHAADVGISVDTAVDVAKEAADIVLLKNDLGVLVQGVRQGRRTFSNTMKYVFMATSANFGNMFSMAGASTFLKFLPLLPKQVLLTNLMTDFPEMTISTDRVDPEWIDKPRRWNPGFIRRFMITFGLLSTVFDFATFGVLVLLLHASEKEFHTGWFVESVISASLVVLVIRTRRSFLKSKPGRYLLLATIAVVCVTLLLPFTGLGNVLGFVPLPVRFYPFLLTIVVLYILGAETAKRFFYSRVKL